MLIDYYRRGSVSLLLLFTMNFSAWSAQENPSQIWTADQLVQHVLANNAELRSYEAEVAAAKGQRTQAGLLKNPEISGEYGSRRITGPEGDLQGDGFTRSVSITQTFEFPGKGSLRKAIADKDIELAELGLKQFRLVLEGQVRSLAFQYEFASENARSAKEIYERSNALIKLLQERSISGTQQLLELRVIEASTVELRKSAKEFTKARDEARLELNALLGWPSSQPLKIEIDRTVPRLKNGDLNQLILVGLANNLSLKIRITELEKAVKEISAAKLEAAPDFSVGPFFSQDKAGDLEENFGAAISLTLPLWNWNQGNVATAKARRTKADSLLLDARRKTESAIARSYRTYELALKQLEEMPEDSVGKIHAAATLADRQYRTGGITMPLYLEVQREFLNVQQAQSEALLEIWRSIFDLQLLTSAEVPLTPVPLIPATEQEKAQ